MRCSEIMKREVEYCLEESLVTEAADAMRDRDVGFLPVCSLEGEIVGVLTDRDVVLRVLAEGRGADRTRVREVMSREVVACSPDDPVAVAEERMSTFQKSRVVCLDERRRPVGIISLSDIARIGSQAHAGAVAASIARREAGPVEALEDRGPGGLDCRDVMKDDVACCRREDTAAELARVMRARDVGFVPICDDDDRVIGTVTDRDLVLRVVGSRMTPETTAAGEILSRDVVSCSPDDSLATAEYLMMGRKKSRILCADDARHPKGVISLADIARVEPADVVTRLVSAICARGPRIAA